MHSHPVVAQIVIDASGSTGAAGRPLQFGWGVAAATKKLANGSYALDCFASLASCPRLRALTARLASLGLDANPVLTIGRDEA